jgi:hypothetical protein
LNINKKRLDHQNNQSFLVGMSITEGAMSREIECWEKQAATRCPVYDSENMYWMKVDKLIKEHSELVTSIKNKTESMFSNSNDDEDSTEIGQFLNQPSPDKKRKAIVLDETTEIENKSLDNMFDLEGENNEDSDSDVAVEKVVASESNDANLKGLKSIEVKKEIMKKATVVRSNKRKSNSNKVSTSARVSPRKMRKRGNKKK